jgi:hypothetical protein
MIIHDNYDEGFQLLGQEGFSYVPLQSSRCWRLLCKSRIESEHVMFKPPTWQIWELLRHLVNSPKWVCLNTGDTPCS